MISIKPAMHENERAVVSKRSSLDLRVAYRCSIQAEVSTESVQTLARTERRYSALNCGFVVACVEVGPDLHAERTER